MGIRPESSHHEQGPGQNEIDFVHSGALTAADDLVTFKSVVKTVAARNGLFASFMPKLYADQSGSGLHINLSLSKDGLNIFKYGMEEHSKGGRELYCRDFGAYLRDDGLFEPADQFLCALRQL